jgi:hypothetical protein
MSKTSLLLATATVILGGSAYMLESSRTSKTSAGTNEALFPDLKSQMTSVAQVVIQTGNGTWTLDQDMESKEWSLAERDGYAASSAKIGTLLGSLARSKRLQQKTSNPDLYGDLGLQDVGADGSNSSQVSLHTSDGTTLASAIVGRSRTQGTEAHYVRLAGEAATWTASGNLRLNDSLSDWVKTSMLELPATRLSMVEILHPDGNTVYLQRAQEADPNLTIMNLPQGSEASSEWVTSRFTSALTGLSFEDVQKRMDLDPIQVVKSSFRTSDGLVIQVACQLETTEPEVPGTAPTERLLVNLSAAFEELPATPNEGPLAPGSEALIDLGDTPREEIDDSAKIQEEAAQLNQAFTGWTFVLPAHRRNVFLCRLDELVQPIVVEQIAEPVEEASALQDVAPPGDPVPEESGSSVVDLPPAEGTGDEGAGSGEDPAPEETAPEGSAPEEAAPELPASDPPKTESPTENPGNGQL